MASLGLNMTPPASDLQDHPPDDDLHEYCRGGEKHAASSEKHLADCGGCRLKVREVVRAAVLAERRRRGLPARDLNRHHSIHQLSFSGAA